MQAALRNSEWDEVRVQHRGRSIAYIYRRGPGEARFSPWLVAAPSALLARLGRNGLGLYATRTFKRDDVVGQYAGRVVGRYPTRAAALSAPETRRLLRRGHDKLVTVRPPHGPGFHLLDGEGAGPPHIELCNDPRGTALQPNAVLTDAGWLRVIQARVPPFDISKSIHENISSELRIDYTDDYWQLHDSLGCDAEHAIEVD